jgi:Zn-dependent peptidase ImmA (M78 family)/DNA-binding transcriptional regulator YiaG
LRTKDEERVKGMPRTPTKVSVEPAVLKWARESAGLSIEEVAKRVGATVETVMRWESGERQPTLQTLEKLSVFYKRPLAVLFLPAPPQEPPLPRDFRVLPGKQSLPLSRETRLAIRKARRLQSVATELMKELGIGATPKIGKTSLEADPEEVAAEERRRLGIGVAEQIHWKNHYVAFYEWRRAIERLNVLVFQMRMPLEEVRGFSLVEGELPAIVVNSSDSISARIFTLFHEYAHLLLTEAGVCLPVEGLIAEAITPKVERVERFCNHFAGALLVPKDALHKDQVRSIARADTVSDEAIDQIAKEFKVSKQVIWRRMQLTGLISLKKYQTKLEVWEKEAAEKGWKGRRKSSFGIPPAKRCIQEKGPRFTSLILEAKDRDLITYSDVADYLSIRVKHLEKVQSLIEE